MYVNDTISLQIGYSDDDRRVFCMIRDLAVHRGLPWSGLVWKVVDVTWQRSDGRRVYEVSHTQDPNTRTFINAHNVDIAVRGK